MDLNDLLFWFFFLLSIALNAFYTWVHTYQWVWSYKGAQKDHERLLSEIASVTEVNADLMRRRSALIQMVKDCQQFLQSKELTKEYIAYLQALGDARFAALAVEPTNVLPAWHDDQSLKDLATLEEVRKQKKVDLLSGLEQVFAEAKKKMAELGIEKEVDAETQKIIDKIFRNKKDVVDADYKDITPALPAPEAGTPERAVPVPA